MVMVNPQTIKPRIGHMGFPVGESPSTIFITYPEDYLNVPTKVRSQRERAIIVQLLMTSPPHRIAHSLYLDLSSKFQPFPICDVRQHELGLANLAWQRVAGIQTTALDHLSVLALHSHSQHARHAGDTIVGKADDQSKVTAVLIAPDERRPYPITNPAIDSVECCRIRLVVGHQVLCADLVKIPKRPVIGSNIHHMSDHVLCRRYHFMCCAVIVRLTRQTLLEQSCDPRRTVAERFNLLVLNKNSVAANPIVVADRAVEQF